MKNLLLLIAVVAILLVGFYFVFNKDNESVITSQSEDALTQNISWETERISNGPSIPTYNLILNIGNRSFNIRDYWKQDLSGCYDMEEIGRPSGTEAPYESVSDQLCYYIAGGDLFYVVNDGAKYQVFHKTIAEGLPEEPATLLFNVE